MRSPKSSSPLLKELSVANRQTQFNPAIKIAQGFHAVQSTSRQSVDETYFGLFTEFMYFGG